MANLVADDSANRAIVDGVVGAKVEERRLQDRRRAVGIRICDHAVPQGLLALREAPLLKHYVDGTIVFGKQGGYIVADRHKDLYASEPIKRAPSAEDTLEGKPMLQRPVEGMPPPETD